MGGPLVGVASGYLTLPRACQETLTPPTTGARPSLDPSWPVHGRWYRPRCPRHGCRATVSCSCPTPSFGEVQNAVNWANVPMSLVEVAGIEPASSGTLVGLLRAQPTRDYQDSPAVGDWTIRIR